MDYIKAATEKAKKEQSKGKSIETGPEGKEKFQDTDFYKGKPVDANYQTVPEDKAQIEKNLKKAGEEIQTRFGLDERGV